MTKQLDRSLVQVVRIAVVMAATCFETGKPNGLERVLGATPEQLDELHDRIKSQIPDEGDIISLSLSDEDVTVIYRCLAFVSARMRTVDLEITSGVSPIYMPALLGDTAEPALFD